MKKSLMLDGSACDLEISVNKASKKEMEEIIEEIKTVGEFPRPFFNSDGSRNDLSVMKEAE